MTQRLPKSSRRSRSLSQQRLLGYRLRQQRLKRRRMLMEQLEVRHLLAADSLLELPANSRQADVQPLQNDAQPLQNETQTLQNDALPLRASQLIEQASLTESIAIQAALAPTSTIVFVDTGIEGYQSIVEKLTPTDPEDMRLVVLLEADQDGIQQIGNVLRGLKGIDAVHILSHGTSGSLQLVEPNSMQKTLTATKPQWKVGVMRLPPKPTYCSTAVTLQTDRPESSLSNVCRESLARTLPLRPT